MAQMYKLFNGRKVRACWDASKKTWWLSVVDVLAAVRNTDYDTARNHWKQIKRRTAEKLKVSVSRQIKLAAKDGKARYTDVMRYKEIVRLIQKLPGEVARVFKKLIGNIAAGSEAMRRIFDGVCEESGYIVEEKILRTITKRELFRFN